MSEDNGFEVVDRPTGGTGGRRAWGPAAEACIAAMPQAIRVPLNGARYDSARSALNSAVTALGYRLHYRSDGDHLIVWGREARAGAVIPPRPSGVREREPHGSGMTPWGPRPAGRVVRVLEFLCAVALVVMGAIAVIGG